MQATSISAPSVRGNKPLAFKGKSELKTVKNIFQQALPEIKSKKMDMGSTMDFLSNLGKQNEIMLEKSTMFPMLTVKNKGVETGKILIIGDETKMFAEYADKKAGAVTMNTLNDEVKEVPTDALPY